MALAPGAPLAPWQPDQAPATPVLPGSGCYEAPCAPRTHWHGSRDGGAAAASGDSCHGMGNAATGGASSPRQPMQLDCREEMGEELCAAVAAAAQPAPAPPALTPVLVRPRPRLLLSTPMAAPVAVDDVGIPPVAASYRFGSAIHAPAAPLGLGSLDERHEQQVPQGTPPSTPRCRQARSTPFLPLPLLLPAACCLVPGAGATPEHLRTLSPHQRRLHIRPTVLWALGTLPAFAAADGCPPPGVGGAGTPHTATTCQPCWLAATVALTLAGEEGQYGVARRRSTREKKPRAGEGWGTLPAGRAGRRGQVTTVSCQKARCPWP